MGLVCGLFQIQSNRKFDEYMLTRFEGEHDENDLEDWLKCNPRCILGDGGVLLIGRQEPTNLGGFIDLVGVDRERNVVVIELKRDRTPRDTIAQALEYASYVARLDAQQLEAMLRSYRDDDSLDLAKSYRDHFNLGQDEVGSFNEDQRIVIVGQDVSDHIRQSAEFLNEKGARVTCSEFTLFQNSEGKRLISLQIVVDDENPRANGDIDEVPRVIPKKEFLKSCDENGKHLFSRLLTYAESRALEIRWYAKGFSLNVLLNDVVIPVCYCSTPKVRYGQTLYTALHGRGGVSGKTAVPENIIQELYKQASDSEIFVPGGKDLKIRVSRKLADPEIDSLLAWCNSVEKAVRKYGLK